MTDTDHAMAANPYSKYADCMEEIKKVLSPRTTPPSER